jgi:hypothetical protein
MPDPEFLTRFDCNRPDRCSCIPIDVLQLHSVWSVEVPERAICEGLASAGKRRV